MTITRAAVRLRAWRHRLAVRRATARLAALFEPLFEGREGAGLAFVQASRALHKLDGL